MGTKHNHRDEASALMRSVKRAEWEQGGDHMPAQRVSRGLCRDVHLKEKKILAENTEREWHVKYHLQNEDNVSITVLCYPESAFQRWHGCTVNRKVPKGLTSVCVAPSLRGVPFWFRLHRSIKWPIQSPFTKRAFGNSFSNWKRTISQPWLKKTGSGWKKVTVHFFSVSFATGFCRGHSNPHPLSCNVSLIWKFTLALDSSLCNGEL